MQLSEITGGHNVDNIQLKIKQKFEPRSVNARGQDLTVWDFLVEDTSGTEAKLTLWGDTAGEAYNEGEVVEITDGWSKVYNEQVQLSLGRKGKISSVDESLPNQ